MNAIEFKRRPRKKHAKQTLRIEANKAIKSLIITLSCMILALTVAFFATTNSNAQNGYTLQQEKRLNEDLKSKNANIKTRITQQNAFSKLTEEDQITEMEAAEQKTYVTEEDNRVK